MFIINKYICIYIIEIYIYIYPYYTYMYIYVHSIPVLRNCMTNSWKNSPAPPHQAVPRNLSVLGRVSGWCGSHLRLRLPRQNVNKGDLLSWKSLGDVRM